MQLNGFITDQCGAVVIKSRTVIFKINQDVACMQNWPQSLYCGDQDAARGNGLTVLRNERESNRFFYFLSDVEHLFSI